MTGGQIASGSESARPTVGTGAGSAVGIVAIGRNEGERLRACLTSALREASRVIYVDSGSTDGSADLARSLGATVVNLDLSVPFTAARARNAGVARLLEVYPETQFVFFVDGDCEIVAGFIARALGAMGQSPEVAVVCGRRRERYPDASIYNRLCDIEWNTPIGEAKACGGDALVRLSAFQSAGGFNPGIIAGEEPELCVRLRRQGNKILRIDADMTRHDAAMTRFSQWWKRNVRAGHAYAQGARLHGRAPERHWVREVRSNYFWGLGVPVVSIVIAFFTAGIGLLLMVAAYGVLALRIHRRVRGMLGKSALTYAGFIVLGKLPQALGQLRFATGRLLRRPSPIIEYKSARPMEAYR
jgi:GT2 family glycosyltransferase